MSLRYNIYGIYLFIHKFIYLFSYFFVYINAVRVIFNF
jgi:hypothetical protein